MDGLYMDKVVTVTGMENGQVTELKVDGFDGVFTLKAEEGIVHKHDVKIPDYDFSYSKPDDIGIKTTGSPGSSTVRSSSAGIIEEPVGKDCEGEFLFMGDYVVGLDDNGYGVTNENMRLGKIVEDDCIIDEEMSVRVIVHKYNNYVDDIHEVIPQRFRKATPEEIEKYPE